MKNVFIVVVLLMGNIAFADQSSEKARIDDCFAEVGTLMHEANEAQRTGDGNLPVLWGKTDRKRAVCIKIRDSYQAQYNTKYVLPKK